MVYQKGEIRAGRLSLFIFILIFIIFISLFRLQVLKGSYYYELSEKNRLRVLYLEPPRGKILDRKGRTIAASRLSFNCTVIPREAKSTIHETIRVISPVLKVDELRLEESFKKSKAGAFQSVILAEDISLAEAITIEEMLDSMPGVLIETRPQREYPYRDSAAHLLGYTGPMTDQEKEAIDPLEYRPTDWVGRDGVEKFYENYLHGRAGGIQMEVNSRGRFMRSLGVREPRDGRNVELTVDAELQKFTQDLLRNKKGSVIVMELGEGGILAMNSAPSFDSNLFASTRGRKEVGRYLQAVHSPMMNRGIRGQFPPGSIFKMITALAGLENGKLKSTASFHCPGFLLVGGKRFNGWDHSGHGAQRLTEALAHSCDVYFYLTGISAGSESIYSKAVEFGFSQKSGIDLPGEGIGFVPNREWKKKKKNQAWYDGDTANLAIGQGFLQVTPLQALVMTAALATNGDRLAPHVLHKIDGVKVSERHGVRVPMTPAYLEAVKKGLDAAVNTETGTGRLARYPGVRVAGKTGTSQSGQPEDHAWFVGYAPAEKPKVAMVVLIEHGGHGGVAAASVAHEIFGFLKKENYL